MSGLSRQPKKTKIFHVAPDGNDAAKGDRRRPFATLTRAVRAARSAGGACSRRIVVHAGTYYGVSVDLGPEDSGLTIEAAAGEHPVLVGGRPLTGWRKDGRHFIAVDLRSEGNGRWDFRTLLVDGEMAPRARLPERGYFLHQSAYCLKRDAENRPLPFDSRCYATMVYRRGQLGPWLDANNAEIKVFHVFSESTVGVRSLDASKRLIAFTHPCQYPPGIHAVDATGHRFPLRQRYFVSNVREGMLRPGQWYLDRTRSKLVYWPKPRQDMARTRVVAPIGGYVIRIAGTKVAPARGITIKGLALTCATAPGNVTGYGAFGTDGAITGGGRIEDIVLRDLWIHDVGGHGIKMLGPHVRDGQPIKDALSGQAVRIRVERCLLERIGAGGIVIGADDAVIEQNAIRDVGRDYFSVHGINLLCGARGVIRHNDVRGTPYNGIAATNMTDSLVAYNRVSRYVLDLHDGAAIYLGIAKRVRVYRNIVLGGRRRRSRELHNSRHALYTDCHSAGCVLEQNLILDSNSPVHNTSSVDCAILNNLCINQGRTVVAAAVSSQRLSFEKNIVSGRRGVLFINPDAYSRRARNIFFSSDGAVQVQRYDRDGKRYMPVRRMSGEKGVAVADPLLKEQEHGAYSLALDSPVRSFHIRPPDVRKAGLTTKLFKASTKRLFEDILP